MDDGAEKVYEQTNAFAKMWTEFVSKMAASGLAFDPKATPPEAIRQFRDAMLRAMEQYCIEYMRSPEFLEDLRGGMDAAIEARKQLNEMLNRMYSEMQGVTRQDADGMMARMRQIETRVDERLAGIEAKLDRLVEQLGPSRKAPTSAPARSPAAKPKSTRTSGTKKKR
jgi:hypothetical protein